MDDFKFKSLEELYKKVLPALRTKVAELKRINIAYISEEDVWNYLKGHKWSKRSNLTLGEMVNDILWVSNLELEKFKRNERLNEIINN